MDTFLKVRLTVFAAFAFTLIWYFASGERSEDTNIIGEADFVFAALGDAPYNAMEERRFERALQQLEAEQLSFVIHVGDILSAPCSDERYQKSVDWFNQLRHAVIYTPGDNEWTDCVHSDGPLQRLQKLRELFFTALPNSLGKNPLPLESQGQTDPEFAEFIENTRWQYQQVMFATMHLVGSQNGLQIVGEKLVARRTQADTKWMQDTFAIAKNADAKAIVLAFHANPALEADQNNEYRLAYEPFIKELEQQVIDFDRPVLVIHGDNHQYIVDHPLINHRSGETLQHFTRLQVPGSPHVGYVKIAVNLDGDNRFQFQSTIVPRWQILDAGTNDTK